MPVADPEELESWLRLALTPELGSASLRKLLREFGSPQNVVAASLAALRPFVTDEVAAHIRGDVAAPAVATALAWAQEPSNQIVTLADADYPP